METNMVKSPGQSDTQWPLCFPHLCVYPSLRACFCCLHCWPLNCAAAPSRRALIWFFFSWYSLRAIKVWHAVRHLWLSMAVQSESAAVGSTSNGRWLKCSWSMYSWGVFIASIDRRGVEALTLPPPPYFLCLSIYSTFSLVFLALYSMFDDSCSLPLYVSWLLFSPS